MSQILVGRHEEKRILNKALLSSEAELVAIIGRRRVGKTFLIRSTYAKQIKFEMAGVQDANMKEQLLNFTGQLNIYTQPTVPIVSPPNWMTAFQMLIRYLETKIGNEKIAVFFDEIPWLATQKSGFLKAFDYFWNSWASKQNIVVVICGSAASWMIRKIVQNRGGLHNRVTRRIFLEPFNLAETETYFKSRNINMERYQILQIYMAMGGIPHYLKEIEVGKSAVQNIDEICFSKNGLLNDEFSLLYPALFHDFEEHVKLIRLLAETRQGLTRLEIIAKGKFPEGGSTSKILEDLVSSGFISNYYTFGKKKQEMRYRLTDEYSLFYLKFIENKRKEGNGTWSRLSQTQTWKSWSGYAFENIGLKHVAQIKEGLRIGGVYSEASTFINKGKDGLPGVQIDLLIDRNDHVINLFELKFYQEDYILTQAYAEELRQKIALFRAATGTKKQIFLTFLTAFPIIPNQHSIGLIDQALTMDVLFRTIEK